MSISPVSHNSSVHASSVSSHKRPRSQMSAADRTVGDVARSLSFGGAAPSPKRAKFEQEAKPLCITDLGGTDSAAASLPITPPNLLGSLGSIAVPAVGGAGTGPVAASSSSEEPEFSLSGIGREEYVYQPRTSKKKSIEDPFKDLVESIIERSQIAKDGRNFRISPIEGAKGSYSQVYSIQTEDPLLPGVNNENLVIKLFLKQQLKDHGGTLAQSWLKTSLSQYTELSESDLKITKIYNADTAISDGYIIAEKVTPLKEPLWNKDTSIEELKESENMMFMLTSLRKFFEKALNQTGKLALDLQIGNFGWNKDGDLVLCDFKEEEEDCDGSTGSAFQVILNQCLKRVSGENKAVATFLLKGSFEAELEASFEAELDSLFESSL